MALLQLFVIGANGSPIILLLVQPCWWCTPIFFHHRLALFELIRGKLLVVLNSISSHFLAQILEHKFLHAVSSALVVAEDNSSLTAWFIAFLMEDLHVVLELQRSLVRLVGVEGWLLHERDPPLQAFHPAPMMLAICGQGKPTSNFAGVRLLPFLRNWNPADRLFMVAIIQVVRGSWAFLLFHGLLKFYVAELSIKQELGRLSEGDASRFDVLEVRQCLLTPMDHVRVVFHNLKFSK